jgi:hypothetical protein
MNGRRIAFGFDAQGRLVSADDVEVTRGTAGRVLRVSWPGSVVELERDLAGRIRKILLNSVSGFSERFELRRARTGRLVSVKSEAGIWSLARSSDGRLDRIESPEGTVSLSRDARGLVQGVDLDGLSLHLQRDENRRLLRVSGDLGFLLGLQWAADGPPLLTRWANGAIIRASAGLRSLSERLEGPAGEALARREVTWDRAGRLEGVRTDDGGQLRLHRDPTDHIIVLEGPEEVWSAVGDRLEGPNEELVLLDDAGRPEQGYPASGRRMWGIAQGRIDYRYDASGKMSQLVGESGVAALTHDALGRLRRVTLTSAPDPLTGARTGLGQFAVDYDPFGQIRGLSGPGTRLSLLGHSGFLRARDGVDTDRLQVRVIGGSELLIDRASGGDGDATVFFSGRGGLTSRAVHADGSVRSIRVEPTGHITAGRATGTDAWVGAAGQLRLFPGGPLVGEVGALDPVSGQWTSGARSRFPWVHEPVFPLLELANEGVSAVPEPLSLAATTPLSPWSDPLRMFVSLGVITDPTGSGWGQLAGPPGVFPWLPSELDGGEPWVGPTSTQVPFAVAGPLLQAMTRSVLEGKEPPAFDALARAVLADLEPTADRLDPLSTR